MNAKHLVIHFVAPVFFYLAVVLYFVAGLSILASLGTDPGFLIIGLIMFLLAYNSWIFAKTMREVT